MLYVCEAIKAFIRSLVGMAWSWRLRARGIVGAVFLVAIMAVGSPASQGAVAAPANLCAEPADASVVLSWDRCANQVEWYHVFRSTQPGGPYERVMRMKAFRPGSPLHGLVADAPVANGTTYYYVVKAETPEGMSPASNEASATPRRNTEVPVPRIVGEWTRIAPHSPDLGRYDNGDQDNACDFTIFQAGDGTWQLIACIRSTLAPGRTRLFYRWEGKHLTDADWEPMGIFAEAIPEPPHNQVQGRMQAPHCFRHDGRYVMFYNSAGAHVMVSDDGKHFERIPNAAGSFQHFSMNRDVFILDNADRDGRWYAYYTNNEPGMAVKWATNLMGPWTEQARQVPHHGFFESPFVQRYAGHYYLFVPCMVFVSDDPLDFDKPLLTQLTDAKGTPKAAIEIIQDAAGNYYIAGYGKGIYVAKLQWQPPARMNDP